MQAKRLVTCFAVCSLPRARRRSYRFCFGGCLIITISIHEDQCLVYNVLLFLFFYLATGKPKEITDEGLETIFAGNYFGPFLFTNLVLGNLYHSHFFIVFCCIFFFQKTFLSSKICCQKAFGSFLSVY